MRRARKFCRLWCVQTAILLMIFKWTFFSFEGHSDTDAVEMLNQSNSLLAVDSLPHFYSITPADVISSITQAAEEFQKHLEEYERQLQENRNIPRTWEFVEESLEVLQFPFSYCWQVFIHLLSVKSSPELREAQEKLQPIYVTLSARVDQSLIVYGAFKELNQGDQNLDTPQRRILQTFLMSARQGGAELNEQEKNQLNLLNLELLNSTSKFRDNVMDSTKGFSILLTDRESVDGLPEPTRRLMASYAVDGTEQSANPEDGPWKVTFDSQTFGPVMKHSRNRTLREHLYRAYITRACEGEFSNNNLIETIRDARLATANLLGYIHYADLSLASKMVKKVEEVWTFLNTLQNKSYPVAQAELQSLKEFARSRGHSVDLQLWDIPFWNERQYEAIYSLKEEDVRPFFPLERVLSGLFKLCMDLFGVIIHAADGATEVWDPDVRFFNVYDEKENHLASFYLDPYSRPNEKNSGAWMSEFLTRSRLLHHIPVAFMVCNQIPPVGTMPSLMSFREVSTLFHEFGHALQHMLTTVPYAGASGIHNIEGDAVEVASQFMENWLYDWHTITFVSGHYETGESLPYSMFQKFFRAKQYLAGSEMLSQLYIAALDMELHTSPDSWSMVAKRVADKFAVPKHLPEDCTPCTISHIFGGDTYAAGYYSYKWSELLAQDAFEAFTEVGLQNRDKIIETGRRFRDTFLSLGGGTPPLEVFRMFRGRDPSTDALLRKYGLLQK
ncbi:uncharacterized protein [Ambystoma mexicanum]|uniref:uncharacterized protein isoform X2 n=1 Tax=Ambystoma mexicanum TaxID=8296 RepID=UPI0037E75306